MNVLCFASTSDFSTRGGLALARDLVKRHPLGQRKVNLITSRIARAGKDAVAPLPNRRKAHFVMPGPWTCCGRQAQDRLALSAFSACGAGWENSAAQYAALY
jgi:hypothetical protein